VSVATLDELTRYRWSSDDEDDRFPVENPATGKVITVVQGGGAKQMNWSCLANPGRAAVQRLQRAASARLIFSLQME